MENREADVTQEREKWDEMKELLKACRLTYVRAAHLAGVSKDTMRAWLKPATGPSGYKVPDPMLAYFRWLAASAPEFRKEEDTPVSLIARLLKGEFDALADEHKNLDDLATRIGQAEQRPVEREITLARNLIAAATPLAMAGILARCQLPPRPVAYEWRDGAFIVALLSATEDNKISVVLCRDVVTLGRAWVEIPKAVFTFDPALCADAFDDASAKQALLDCLYFAGTVGLGAVFGPLVQSVLVAHILLNGMQARLPQKLAP